MNKHAKPTRLLCMLLTLLLLAACLPMGAASAASTPTSLGLAGHGLMAYNDGWVYVYGAKGQQYGDTRASDCAGLLYAYFSDLGVGGCAGGATSQVTQNCIFSDSIYSPYGIPRIHGLAVTVFDKYEPETGIYGHIGIYIGNNEAVDNSDYGTDMVRGSIYTRDWASWHLFDNGVMYPKDGWYEFDGKMVHYTGYEYDIETTVDGYYIGSDGFAQNPDGTPAAVVESMISDYYVPASEVRDWLYATGWDGDDTPDTPIDPDGPNNPGDPGDDPNVPEEPVVPSYDGEITASSVNLRSEPSTSSSVVGVLHRGDKLILQEAVEGGEASSSEGSSTLWYPVTTEYGESGYISSLFVKLSLSAPSITSDGQSVIIQAGGADVYYTVDGSDPDLNSIPYTIPIYMLGFTYKAVASRAGLVSDVTTATVLSNGEIFTDFTYNDWFAATVDKAVSLGLFKGAGNQTFSPNNLMTRAQFLQVLANMSGEDISGCVYGDEPLYSDVSPRDYFYNAVVWATEKGILSAASGVCNPNANISREEMCVMLGRFIQSTGELPEVDPTNLFTDDSSISGWAKRFVYALRDMGVVNGSGNNMFNPKGTATRAAACSLVMGYYTQHLSDSIAPAT
ncbi:S-layer homology domain-containing protein [Oscillospiraceae bacterium 42-9]